MSGKSHIKNSTKRTFNSISDSSFDSKHRYECVATILIAQKNWARDTIET